MGSALRRAGGLLVEPAPAAPPTRPLPLDVVVTSLGTGAGATAAARGLAIALRRLRPVELTGMDSCAPVAAGPGTVVVRDTVPADAGPLCHRGAGRVLVAVADARREPPLAALVRAVLADRHERVVLVGSWSRTHALAGAGGGVRTRVAARCLAARARPAPAGRDRDCLRGAGGDGA